MIETYRELQAARGTDLVSGAGNTGGQAARGTNPTGTDLAPGWYAISVNYVMGTAGSAPDGQGNLVSLRPDACTFFQQLIPIARAGYSIDIYHVEAANSE